MSLPVTDFAEKWDGHISASIPSDVLTRLFEGAGSACLSLSGITSCCGLNDYRDEEDELLDRLINQFEENKERLSKVATTTENEIIAECCNCLDQMWDRWIDEREAMEAGQAIERPLCEDPYLVLNGENVEESNYFGSLIILLCETGASLGLGKIG